MDFITPEILPTDDGSSTFRHPICGEHYHSDRGAAAEALHVYIHAGLDYVVSHGGSAIRVLEMGFGSGLNALLTMDYALKNEVSVDYVAVEKYPVAPQLLHWAGYDSLVSTEVYTSYMELIWAPWDAECQANALFKCRKMYGDILDIDFGSGYQVVYWDAFAPDCAPELWSEAMFGKVFSGMASGGVLVTYSAKGDVKRALRAVGFTVDRLQGALGKHHMLRAAKP